jgi:uncharacterized cupredoxin-like copper-binding protein
MLKHPMRLTTGAVAAGLLIAGCGGAAASTTHSASTTSAAGYGSATRVSHVAKSGQTLHVMAASGGQLRFTMTTLSAKAGKVTIVMSNPSNSGLAHGIAIQGQGVNARGPIVSPGKTSSVTATLKKGMYTYYCPVPGHRQAGMQGMLKVG